MNHIETFLESSTIHGLSNIQKEKRFSRLFWIIVVFSGFSGAVVLIYKSFKSWTESPITTTVETLPISDLTFPNVTVCPPKDTYTNLNFDLFIANNMTFTNDSRNELLTDALDLIYNYHFEQLMKNQSYVNESNRYLNWYHGISKIIPAFYSSKRNFNQLINYVETTSTFGSISTQHFGEEFNVSKVLGYIFYYIDIYVPESARNLQNLSLYIMIDKNSIKSTGQDLLVLEEVGDLPGEISYFPHKFSPQELPRGKNSLKLDRKITNTDIEQLNMKRMPGFKLSWFYSENIQQDLKFSNDVETLSFVRYLDFLKKTLDRPSTLGWSNFSKISQIEYR